LDGAIVGLDLAIHHPEGLTKLFAFAANSGPTGVKDTCKNKIFHEYMARAARREYQLFRERRIADAAHRK